MVAMSVGERIRKAREEKGWSQRELARRTEIHFNSINAWENGRTTPTKVYVAVLEGALNVSLRPPAEGEREERDEAVTLSSSRVGDVEYVREENPR